MRSEYNRAKLRVRKARRNREFPPRQQVFIPAFFPGRGSRVFIIEMWRQPQYNANIMKKIFGVVFLLPVILSLAGCAMFSDEYVYDGTCRTADPDWFSGRAFALEKFGGEPVSGEAGAACLSFPNPDTGQTATFKTSSGETFSVSYQSQAESEILQAEASDGSGTAKVEISVRKDKGQNPMAGIRFDFGTGNIPEGKFFDALSKASLYNMIIYSEARECDKFWNRDAYRTKCQIALFLFDDAEKELMVLKSVPEK